MQAGPTRLHSKARRPACQPRPASRRASGGLTVRLPGCQPRSAPPPPQAGLSRPSRAGTGWACNAMFFAIRFSFVSVATRLVRLCGFRAGVACAAPRHRVRGDADPDVVVTATRIETPLERSHRVDASSSTATRSSAAAPTTRRNCCASMRASTCGRNGGPGQPTAVFIRGAESNHTLVLIDGVRINPGTIGLPALQNIPPGHDRAHRGRQGPRSALWGTDAIGGVINVITRRGSRDGWSAEVGLRRLRHAQGQPERRLRRRLERGHRFRRCRGSTARISDPHVRRHRSRLRRTSARTCRRASTSAPANWRLRHWRTDGTSEYSDFFLAPVDQDFERRRRPRRSCLPVGVGGQCAPSRCSHFEDRIEQNQSTGLPAHATRLARRARPTGRLNAAQPARCRRHGVRARKRAAYRSARRSSEETDIDHGVRAGPRGCRPRTARCSRLVTRTTKPRVDAFTWNVEYGFRRTPADAPVRARPAPGFARRTPPIASGSAATRTSIPRVRTITRPACATR